MIERQECPDCESWDTERVHVDWEQDRVFEVRVCNDCPVEYTVEFADPIKEVTKRAEEA